MNPASAETRIFNSLLRGHKFCVWTFVCVSAISIMGLGYFHKRGELFELLYLTALENQAEMIFTYHRVLYDEGLDTDAKLRRLKTFDATNMEIALEGTEEIFRAHDKPLPPIWYKIKSSAARLQEAPGSDPRNQLLK